MSLESFSYCTDLDVSWICLQSTLDHMLITYLLDFSPESVRCNIKYCRFAKTVVLFQGSKQQKEITINHHVIITQTNDMQQAPLVPA